MAHVRGPVRLAIVVSHPIQHFVSFYRALSARPELDVRVLFSAPTGLQAYFDVEMNTTVSWKMDLLTGYAHEFLREDGSAQPGFWTTNDAQLGRRLDDLRPDVLIVYGYSQLNALRALWWAKRRGVPVLMISDSERLQHRGSLKRLAKEAIVSLIYRQVAAFLTVGDRNEENYTHYGVRPEQLFRCPFTVDEAVYAAAARDRDRLRKQVRDELGLAPQVKVALFVGKLSPRKRAGDLIAALRETREPWVAMVAGNGEEREQLEHQATGLEDRVRFLGFTNLDRLPAVYAAADVLVVPSAADPHPLVCSEAACIGLPLVLSDRVGAAGPSDIAQPGRNALVYRCGEPAALAAALDQLDTARLGEMGRASREVFASLDLERSVSGVLDALRYLDLLPPAGHRGDALALASPLNKDEQGA